MTRILWSQQHVPERCLFVLTFFICIWSPNVTMIFPKQAYNNWPGEKPSSLAPLHLFPWVSCAQLYFCSRSSLEEDAILCSFTLP